MMKLDGNSQGMDGQISRYVFHFSRHEKSGSRAFFKVPACTLKWALTPLKNVT